MDVVSSCPTSAQQTLELRGHLIDSLTLSKVIDRIQQLGGDYRLNDIRIGTLKKDISSVNLTVMAPDEGKLKQLVEEVSHYGALPTGQINVETMNCRADGELPPEAFAIKLPERVYYDGRWLDLKAGECLGISIYPEQNEARLEKEADVRKGTLVVSGTQGIEW